MMSTPLVLVGGGGHASDVLQAIEACNALGAVYAVRGILADDKVDPRRFAGRGVKLIGGIDHLARVDGAFVLCLGWPNTRAAVAARIGDVGHPAAPIVDPSATVGVGAVLAAGTVVLGNAHVSPMVGLGAHSLVSYTASVGHDTTFGDFASLMPGANVSGDVLAGDEVLIGSGAVIREGVRLGHRVRVGAGAVVLDDVADGLTVVGVPARPLTKRTGSRPEQ